jgi:hypothetical protein
MPWVVKIGSNTGIRIVKGALDLDLELYFDFRQSVNL